MDTKEALEQTVKNTADDIERMANGTYEIEDPRPTRPSRRSSSTPTRWM